MNFTEKLARALGEEAVRHAIVRQDEEPVTDGYPLRGEFEPIEIANIEQFAIGDGFTFRLFGFRLLRIEAIASTAGYVVLTLHAEIADRDTDAPATIQFKRTFPRCQWESGQKCRAECVRQLARRFVSHEIDEHIYVNGERVFDPHTGAQS